MRGKLTIPKNTNIWPHEKKTAEALVAKGHRVVFKRKSEGYKVHSADAYIDGRLWEFKAPNSSKLDAVERNLRRAKKQSGFIVFDSIRMKNVPDYAIKREILSKAPLIKDIQKIIFVNRKRECIDIFKRKR